MTAAGHKAESALSDTIEKYEGQYICVVEGAVPTKDNGVYCKIGGRAAMEILDEVAPNPVSAVSRPSIPALRVP